MKNNKDIKVRSDARFIIVIDENFDFVNMIDLKNGDTRLNAKESHEILKCCFGSLKYIVNMVEIKAKQKEKDRLRNIIKKNITIVK